MLTPDQSLVSSSGRLVSLPAPVTRRSNRWLVPVEFISRALAPIYDVRLDFRPTARLLVIGDLRVPRVTAQYDVAPASLRVTFEITPRATATVTQEQGRLLVRVDADALDATLPPPPQQQLLTGIRATEPTTIQMDLGQRFATFRASPPISSGAAAVITVELLAAGADTSSAAAPTAPGAPAAPNAPVAPSCTYCTDRRSAGLHRRIASDHQNHRDRSGTWRRRQRREGSGWRTRERCHAGSRPPRESGDRRTPRHARAADARRRQPRRRRWARRHREQQQGRLVHQPARQRLAAPDRARRRHLHTQPRSRRRGRAPAIAGRQSRAAALRRRLAGGGARRVGARAGGAPRRLQCVCGHRRSASCGRPRGCRQ